MSVKISFTPSEPIAVELDMNRLKFGQTIELLNLRDAGDEESVNAIIGIVNDICSTDIRELGVLDAREIIETVFGALQGDIAAEKN